MKELDPSKDIINLETFQCFMQNFRSRVLKSPPHRKPFPSNLPPDPANSAMYTTIDNPYHEESIRNQLEEVVFMDSIPWDYIPKSLQQLLSMQYDSAGINEDKNINIRIRRRDARFSLQSTHSHHNIDLKGEYYTPGLSLRILRTDFDDEAELMVGGQRINEGDFIVVKKMLSTQLIFNSLLQQCRERILTVEEKDFLEWTTINNSWRKVKLISSTTAQLQDIAKLLREQKDKAFIYSNL